VIERSGFIGSGARTADEALQLLAAPNCPSGTMDVVLMPDQMMLQIHESIGHPLELDRILGDERNYAGTSFVTLDMFGSYQYGSPLLNVTYDPTRSEEFASFAFDDEGTPPQRDLLIKDGVLLRPLGGTCRSSARSGIGRYRGAWPPRAPAAGTGRRSTA
jgi:predicted Zn-dependent protease